jgi:hypothetical protein
VVRPFGVQLAEDAELHRRGGRIDLAHPDLHVNTGIAQPLDIGTKIPRDMSQVCTMVVQDDREPDQPARLAVAPRGVGLQEPLARGLGASTFTPASVPSPLAVWWAAAFTVALLAWAMRSFQRRAL